MRKTLEELYYCNIDPCEERVTANSRLQHAIHRVTECEERLAELLGAEGCDTLAELTDAQQEIINNVLGKTQAEVREKCQKAIAENTELDWDSEDYTVAPWLRTWYDLYAQPNIRTASANRFQLQIKNYIIPRIVKIKLKKLTGRDVQRLFKDLAENGRTQNVEKCGRHGLAASTIRSVHIMLHNALGRARRERLITYNPTEDGVAPKLVKKR